jgi:hypothetical protein
MVFEILSKDVNIHDLDRPPWIIVRGRQGREARNE